MPISAVERRFVLDQLGKRAQQDMVRLWDAAARFADEDFFRFVSEAFPDIAVGYHQLAAEFAAMMFVSDFPRLAAKPSPPPAVGVLTKSAQWALGGDGRQALDRLSGTLQRTVYDGDRQTTARSAVDAGMRWMRVARPDSCAFCRMLASRTDLYRSKRSAGGYSSKYHDDCRCVVKAFPADVSPRDALAAEDPDLAVDVDMWGTEYVKAREAAGSGDVKKILAAWREMGAR